jgi:hypothetical protein
VYKDLEDKSTETDGFRDRATTLTVIEEARQRASWVKHRPPTANL